MLHSQAGTCYADPADEAHEDGLAAGFHELHEIGVQANGGHGHDDEELGKRLQWRERRRIGASGHGDGGDDAGHEEEQDEHREGALQREVAEAVGALLAGHDDAEHERDGDDGERSREFHDGGVVQGVRAGMHAVPGSCGGGDRRGVVHGGAGE